MDKANLFWQVYLNLENEIIDLSKYIYFTDTTTKIDNRTKEVKVVDNNHQIETYSAFIADLLVRCCVEIEAISKELYFDNGGTKSRGEKDIYFDTDCIALLNKKWDLESKVVIISAFNFDFTKEENRILTPLKDADKRSKTYWEKSYQAVKHDRYNSLYQGNIKALLQAMGALYLLNVYYKNITISTKYLEYRKLDMSFGSKIFSLKQPNEKFILDAVNGKEIKDVLHSIDSPYILKYTNSFYKQVVEACRQVVENRNRYWLAQPELKEPLFIKQLEEAKRKEIANPQNRCMHLWELCQYRLNKKIPADLPFEERKRLFIQSSEWSGHIRQINHPKKESELTAENLQAEINNAGILAGMELEQSFDNIRMTKAFTDGYCELVLDKGNVKYDI